MTAIWISYRGWIEGIGNGAKCTSKFSPATGYVCTEEATWLKKKDDFLSLQQNVWNASSPCSLCCYTFFRAVSELKMPCEPEVPTHSSLTSPLNSSLHFWCWPFTVPRECGHCRHTTALGLEEGWAIIGCNWESGAPSSFVVTESRPTTFLLGLASSKGMKKLWWPVLLASLRAVTLTPLKCPAGAATAHGPAPQSGKDQGLWNPPAHSMCWQIA